MSKNTDRNGEIDLIVIANKGQAIENTNYWDSEHAKRGIFFLSWNAGAARLLVPDSQKPALREMRTAKYVVVSFGQWPAADGREAFELLFEDESDSPFCLTMGIDESDRRLPENTPPTGFWVAVWTRGGMKLRLPGKYRAVKELPCLAPWGTV